MDDEDKKAQNQVQNVGVVAREVERPVSDYASEKELQVSEELERIGVEKVSDKPQIGPVNEQIGVKLPSELSPVQSPSDSSVVSLQSLMDQRKKDGPESSMRWETELEIREELKRIIFKKAA